MTSSGGATSGMCKTDADCGSEKACVYKISEACEAHASCQPRPAGGQLCGAMLAYCDCSGKVVSVGCGEPSGYASVPVVGPEGLNGCKPAH
jgi:hypothetical protein